MNKRIIDQMMSGQSLSRLVEISGRLEIAANQGDLEDVTRLDHELRCAALAVVGTISKDEQQLEQKLQAVRNALQAVDMALTSIHSQKAKLNTKMTQSNRLRLAYKRQE